MFILYSCSFFRLVIQFSYELLLFTCIRYGASAVAFVVNVYQLNLLKNLFSFFKKAKTSFQIYDNKIVSTIASE